MDRGGYIAILVAVIVLLVALFFALVFVYKRTPVPKGCENLERDPTICGECAAEVACPMKLFVKEKKADEQPSTQEETKHESDHSGE